MIGDPAHLAFELKWPSVESPDVRGLGWCNLLLWVGGRPVWSGENRDPVAWTWIDLVEHLARAWGHLLFEENAPFGLVAATPAKLREHGYLRAVQGKTEAEVEDAVHSFQHRHDLAAGLKGIKLPAVWLLREGNTMRVHAEGRDLWRPRSETKGVLEAFVADVKSHVRTPAPRARIAFKLWDEREPSNDLYLRLRTCATKAQLKAWVPGGNEQSAWWGLSGHETPIMAAARLSQPLSDETRKTLLLAISMVAAGETPELDELTAEAVPVLDAVIDQRPYFQGYTLAQWLRTKLALGDAVDPAALLSGWGVHVAALPQVEEGVDAVACWGGRGPAVLVNPAGRHAGSEAGKRATLAHEIAHLVLDRGRFLPLAEVFGGATPQHLEQRAKAFAAELLLPRDLASSALAKHSSLTATAGFLQQRYGVSREVVGWQIKNGTGWTLLNKQDRSVVTNWASPRSQSPS